MPQSRLRLIKRSAEFCPRDDAEIVPRKLRGIYVLYERVFKDGKEKFNVQYIGMARAGRGAGIRGRLLAHRNSKKKSRLWTHFSIFEVWDNVRDEEVVELEGIFRHIYRKDTSANKLNAQGGFGKLRSRKVRQDDFRRWKPLTLFVTR